MTRSCLGILDGSNYVMMRNCLIVMIKVKRFSSFIFQISERGSFYVGSGGGNFYIYFYAFTLIGYERNILDVGIFPVNRKPYCKH